MTAPTTLANVLACVLLSLISLCQPAIGQTTVQTRPSEHDLRAENQRLQDRIEQLERDLKAANDRIAQLEQRQSGQNGSGNPPAGLPAEPIDERITIDESQPHASPQALLRALKASYERDPAKLEIGRLGDAKRRAYLRRLEGWRAIVEREFRGPINWHVKAIGPGDPPFVNGNQVVRFVAVDPVSGVQLGNPFDVTISRVFSDRLAEWESRDELDTLVMRGVLHPRVIINPERNMRGSFDNPPYIGPFAEMNFDITVQSLVLASDVERQKAATRPAEKSSPGGSNSAKTAEK